METTEREKLLDYLKKAIDLETEVATQQQIALSVNNTWNEKKPKLVTTEIPQDTNVYEKEEMSEGCLAGILGGIGMGIFGLIFLIATADYHNEATTMGLVWVGISAVITTLCIRKSKKNTNTVESWNSAKRESYRKQCEQIEEKNKQNKSRFDKDFNTWNTSIEKLNQIMEQPLEETKKILEKLYTQNIIYPKYCNLPALTSIYEYFITGRCDELTGPHGAYNMYEDEMRKDTVISQLSVVIDNLEQIKNNQYMLYQQVSSIQTTTKIIASEVQQVKGYALTTAQLSALTAYYTGLTASNTQITAALEMWNA